ncbi:uncharacterized protein [Musca autumnalis]|uniref:uncharacterized protein n=1 Tax=Musca autumnalis TaxID=221902 RepID=UPI003CED7EB8
MVCSTTTVGRYIFLVTVLLLNTSLRSVGAGDHDDCFVQYNSAQNENILEYQNATLTCRNDSRKGNSYNLIAPTPNYDVETEKDNFARTTEEICNNMQMCGDLDDLSESLQCYIEATRDGFHKSMDMHFNATLIVIELNEDYEENDRNVLRCIQKTKETFLKESLAEYQRLLQCLEY